MHKPCEAINEFADLEAFQDCALCPRECHVDRLHGGSGFCRSGSRARISRAALHFWEEPPISGSSGSGTVFFSGCGLGCIYCQNHAISRGGAGRDVSIDELSDIFFDLERQGAMNINLVTPTHFAPMIRQAVQKAKSEGLSLPIVWNTSGYEQVSQIDLNAGCIDIYLADFKYADDMLAEDLSGVRDYSLHALEAIERMVSITGSPVYDEFNGEKRLAKGVVIRHMTIPGHLDDSMRVLDLLYERFGGSVLYSIMNQYTPVLNGLAEKGNVFAERALRRFPELAGSVTDEEYEKLLDYADGIGMQDYFWQEGGTCSESFIPDFE